LTGVTLNVTLLRRIKAAGRVLHAEREVGVVQTVAVQRRYTKRPAMSAALILTGRHSRAICSSALPAAGSVDARQPGLPASTSEPEVAVATL
jgi:hypothetical protein